MRTGSLVEQGSHENLLETGSLYAEYYNTMVEAEPLSELHEEVFDYEDSPLPTRSEQVSLFLCTRWQTHMMLSVCRRHLMSEIFPIASVLPPASVLIGNTSSILNYSVICFRAVVSQMWFKYSA